ncbi:hypothetical protein L195_g049792 [Trifolium pratense]|uniref:Uncharacterized protein n=1 Tax=Trifolium pratense TaxID=57577 RepID=A0A2K3JQH1_TRIPR|nr:hypothetical protein L195_g049792 [Trifolium pratense]
MSDNWQSARMRTSNAWGVVVRIWRMVIVFVFLKEFEEKECDEKVEVMGMFLRRRSFNIAMKKECCVVAI